MSSSIPETMTYQQRCRQKCLEEGRRYYEENKKMVQKMARDRYRGLSEQEKGKKIEYTRNRYCKLHHSIPFGTMKCSRFSQRFFLLTDSFLLRGLNTARCGSRS